MKKFNVSKVLTFVLILFVVTCLATSSFADNTPIIIGGSTNTENNTASNTPSTNVASNNVTQPTTISSYNNTANKVSSTLPKTGEADVYIVSILIAVCGISAVYAYKKIRDYNNM